jgi:hypothetical protein
MPSSKCSGPTERLASLAASSRENASISDSFGENCVVIYNYFLQSYNNFCKHRAIKTKFFPLKKHKIFVWLQINYYLCTVKNASAGLKMALNAKIEKL